MKVFTVEGAKFVIYDSSFIVKNDTGEPIYVACKYVGIYLKNSPDTLLTLKTPVKPSAAGDIVSYNYELWLDGQSDEVREIENEKFEGGFYNNTDLKAAELVKKIKAVGEIDLEFWTEEDYRSLAILLGKPINPYDFK